MKKILKDLCEQNLVILRKDNVVALSIDGVVVGPELVTSRKMWSDWDLNLISLTFLVSTLIIRPLDHFQLHTTHQQWCQSWNLITIWK